MEFSEVPLQADDDALRTALIDLMSGYSTSWLDRWTRGGAVSFSDEAVRKACAILGGCQYQHTQVLRGFMTFLDTLRAGEADLDEDGRCLSHVRVTDDGTYAGFRLWWYHLGGDLRSASETPPAGVRIRLRSGREVIYGRLWMTGAAIYRGGLPGMSCIVPPGVIGSGWPWSIHT